MKKTFKSILAVVMAFIMVSGFVSAFAVENVVYPSDYVEKVTITNHEKCATIIESEDGDLIAPSTEGETVTLIFTDGTEKSFVYADEIKVEFPDGKEYEIYAGIEGSSLSYIVSIIDENGEEYIIWHTRAEIVEYIPDFTIEYAVEYLVNELFALYVDYYSPLPGSSGWQNIISCLKATPDFINDVIELVKYASEQVVEYYAAK